MANGSSNTQGVSYVEWGSVIAGTVLACAVSVVLWQFGQAIGLAIPRHYDNSYTAIKVFTIGLWLLWVQLMASMSGGYLAGRMRGTWANASASESELRDGAHGLLVWATSSLVVVAAAAFGAFLTVLAAQHGVDVAQEVQNKSQLPEGMVHKYGAIFGFALAATSIVSAVAAYGMGIVGGNHRDGDTDISRFSFRKAASKRGK